MKKALLLLLLLVLVTIGYSQGKLNEVLPLQNGKVIYTAVVAVDSAKKSELYDRAERWLVEEYKSPKDVIQLDDREIGEIIGKGYFPTTYQFWFLEPATKVSVYHTIKISVKDGRYKYAITDLDCKWFFRASMFAPPSHNAQNIEEFLDGRKKDAKKYDKGVDEQIQSIIKSLKKFMATPANSDW